ncbi:hypothetical protein BJY00DRAFT_310504 [Aspergillus carlsbadensis]|nr:hypothetical protein BJY00DRAFT_310504 [Aspergillus carlsbadensis]
MPVNQSLVNKITSQIANRNGLQSLVPEIRSQLDATYYFGLMTARAARGGHLESYQLAVHELCRYPADEVEEYGTSALDEAIRHGHHEIANDLLDTCLQLTNQLNVTLYNALQTAVLVNNVPFTKYVLTSGVDPTTYLRLPMRRACEEGTKDLLLLMLARVEEHIAQVRDNAAKMIRVTLLLHGALLAPAHNFKPLMVLLVLPHYARTMKYLTEPDDKREHTNLMRDLREFFEHPSFARDVSSTVKFATFSRQDCLDVLHAMAADLPWLLVQHLSGYLREDLHKPHDFKLTVGGKGFLTHRDVLTQWSALCQIRFPSVWSDVAKGSFEVGISKETFQEVLDFMYTGRLMRTDLPEGQLKRLCHAGKALGIAPLIDQVSKLL